MTAPFATQRARMPDMGITMIAIVLATAGVAISNSALVFHEAVGGGSRVVPMSLVRSIAHLVMGLGAMAVTLIPDYRRLTRPGAAWVLFVGVTALLGAALASPSIENTHRWLRVAGMSIQPSELAKVVLVLVVATALVRSGDDIRTSTGLLRPLVLGGWIAGLVLLGKDLGTPVLMFSTVMVLCIAAGASWKHLGAIGAFGLVGGIGAVLVESYRQARMTGFLHSLTLSGNGISDKVPYQLKQSLLAIGSGGPIGKGFGLSTQKAFFLPEVDNDFIFSFIAEELGLVGALLVLAAFLVLAWRGLRVARAAQDDLGRYIALGATWLLCFQALCHMGVATGILPTKGLTLPFFSTGGWSLVASCALAGLLMNVSARRRPYGA